MRYRRSAGSRACLKRRRETDGLAGRQVARVSRPRFAGRCSTRLQRRHRAGAGDGPRGYRVRHMVRRLSPPARGRPSTSLSRSRLLDRACGWRSAGRYGRAATGATAGAGHHLDGDRLDGRFDLLHGGRTARHPRVAATRLATTFEATGPPELMTPGASPRISRRRLAGDWASSACTPIRTCGPSGSIRGQARPTAPSTSDPRRGFVSHFTVSRDGNTRISPQDRAASDCASEICWRHRNDA